MSSRDPMPRSAAVRLCSSLMVRRGARLGTAPGATLSASCPAWSSRFVVCAKIGQFQKSNSDVAHARGTGRPSSQVHAAGCYTS